MDPEWTALTKSRKSKKRDQLKHNKEQTFLGSKSYQNYKEAKAHTL